MDKPLSKAAQKRADAEAMTSKVTVAMAEAEQAAADAFDAFAKTAERTPDGHIKDACGGSYVFARKPSYPFRKAMVDGGFMRSSYDARWDIGQFQNVVTDQSVTAAERACTAAADVLKRHFPDEPIYHTSYLS